MKEFPKDFKESLILKSLQPSGPSLVQLAEEYQIPYSTIYGWKQKYANHSSMSKDKKWSPEKKLEVINKTFSMNETEVGEFLRKNGFHSSDLEQWKNDIYVSLRGPGRPKKDPELAKLQQSEKALKKDLRRKEKALAEMSARVVLLKKSHEIWGLPEDDEQN